MYRIFYSNQNKQPVEDTCRTYYRTFVHIQSIGRYDSIGATCHRESDKKCTAGDLSLPLSWATYRGRRRRVFDSPLPRCHFSSTSLSSLHITKGHFAALGSGLKLQRHRPLSLAAARVLKLLYVVLRYHGALTYTWYIYIY